MAGDIVTRGIKQKLCFLVIIKFVDANASITFATRKIKGPAKELLFPVKREIEKNTKKLISQ